MPQGLPFSTGAVCVEVNLGLRFVTHQKSNPEDKSRRVGLSHGGPQNPRGNLENQLFAALLRLRVI